MAKSNRYVVGIDPGLRHMGYAVACRSGTGSVEIVEMGVWTTSPGAYRSHVLERANLLAVWLGDLIRRHLPVYCCVEALSYPRSSSAAAKLAMAWGVICGVSMWAKHEVTPIRALSSKQIKRAVTGIDGAGKVDVQRALETRFGGDVMDALLTRVPRSRRNHAYDALGAIIADVEGSDGISGDPHVV